MKKFRPQIYIILLMLALFIVRCTLSNNTSEVKQERIYGRYINQTFLEESAAGLIAETQAYCFALNFISADTVEVDYGFEQARLGYKKLNDRYVLLDAKQGADLAFTLSQDSTLTLMDTQWGKLNDRWEGRAHPIKFQRAKNPQTQLWSFKNWLNAKLVAGEYSLYDQNGFSKGKTPNKAVVKLNPDGSVVDFYNYIVYSICFAGDCLEEARLPANLITFKTIEGKEILYKFVREPASGQINLYPVGPMAKDSNGNVLKGERSVGVKAFVLQQIIKTHVGN